MQHQPAYRVPRVEGRTDAGEGHVVGLKQVHELRERRQRGGEPESLIDHHGVDHCFVEIRDQPLQGGTVERISRRVLVVIAVGQAEPRLILAGGDERLGRFALGAKG